METVLSATELYPNEAGRTPRVLIVEDDLGLTGLIERIFMRSGLAIDIRFAHALSTAKEWMAENAFDLVITDFNLPDGKGLELLPADPESAPYPVMLLTGQGDERVAVQAMKSGAVDYVVKTEESIRALPNTVARLLREWGNELLRREMEKALHQNQLELRESHRQLQELYKIVAQSKKEWELTVDSLDDLIVRLDEHGNICRANRALCQLVGKPIEELLGVPLADIFSAYEIGFQDTRHGLDKLEIFHEESRRWFILNIYNLGSTEIGSGKVITAHDYTALRELTMRLEESNTSLELKSSELESAYEELKATQAKALHQEKMATIGQLAAGVAHEINNPMGFIQSNLGTLRKYLARLTDYLTFQDKLLDAALDPVGRTELEARRQTTRVAMILEDVDDLIHESLDGAERVRKIVADLKGFSHKTEDHEELSDINRLIEDTIPIVWNEIKYKATLHRDYAELPSLRCCPRQLGQVFTNLLVNAVQAIENQGEITIRTRQEDDVLRITVTDTGCGIPEELRTRIFDPFFTTKEVGVGTGLGLSISYDIIKQHGGELLIDSAPGKGSTFTVLLPYRPPPTERTPGNGTLPMEVAC